jgi:hypothetical protein
MYRHRAEQRAGRGADDRPGDAALLPPEALQQRHRFVPRRHASRPEPDRHVLLDGQDVVGVVFPPGPQAQRAGVELNRIHEEPYSSADTCRSSQAMNRSQSTSANVLNSA